MKYLNISTASVVVLMACISFEVYATSVGDSRFQAVFSIKPFVQNDQDDPLSFTFIDGTTQNNSVCSYDGSSALPVISQCIEQDEDISKLPLASSTILEPNFNSVGTDVSIAGLSFNEEENEVFTLGFEDGELTAADLVNPIFNVTDIAIPADFSLYDSKYEAPLRLDVAAVPLPGAVWLLGSGPILAGFVQKKRIAT
jgi:hypothetical protein